MAKAQPETIVERSPVSLLIKAELERDRACLRHHVERIDALISLSFLAERWDKRSGRLLTLEELFDEPRDEIERAELGALTNRIAKEGPRCT